MDITYEKTGSIGLVTLNRPKQMNAMTFQMLKDLKIIFKEIREDSDIAVAVVTGSGDKAFSVGQDLNELNELLSKNDDSLEKAYWDATGYNSILTDDTFNKPVIAALNGHSVGYGLTLALACDIRISSDRARFGFPEVTIGAPTVIGSIKLPRVIALGPAMEILLTGETIDAKEAFRLALVNKIVPPDQVKETAMKLAEKIAKNNHVALKATKELAIRGLSSNFADVLRLGESFRVLSIDREDIQKRLDIFLKK